MRSTLLAQYSIIVTKILTNLRSQVGMDAPHDTQKLPTTTTKKGKKTSKLRSAPVSFADMSPKVPLKIVYVLKILYVYL